MSGTSADGVDASIIQSDGDNKYELILDKYFEYDRSIYSNIHNLIDEIHDSKDLTKLYKKIQSLEKDITQFHANAVNVILNEKKSNIDFIGFHGQTIFHNAKEKISKQLGDGRLLSKLTKKTVICDFRKNDLKNGGNGAPLTPIFHKLLKRKFGISDVTFVNIGGIVNTTTISDEAMSGTDVGPGMCLIDRWLRSKLKKKYDKDGEIAKSGKICTTSLNLLLKNFYEKENSLSKGIIKSFDTRDFDYSLIENLSIEDGAATLTQFTAHLIISFLKKSDFHKGNIILCGGGRKNNFLIEKLKYETDRIKLIDEYKINGDFVESQAFAYLAIRSFLKKPITFPGTTGVKKETLGGIIYKN